jgi:hypothetical protein
MRLPSKFWVQAYVRRMNASGAFATVVKHGDDDLGIVWIRLSRLDGTATLYGPAPEPLSLDEARPERRFLRLHKAESIPEREADERLARQRDFDSDLWIIEVEDRAGRHGLDGLLVAG